MDNTSIRKAVLSVGSIAGELQSPAIHANQRTLVSDCPVGVIQHIHSRFFDKNSQFDTFKKLIQYAAGYKMRMDRWLPT